MSAPETGVLAGLRVLVAEDDALIAAFLKQVLLDFGCEVIGPIHSLSGAHAAIRTADFDCALLDIVLGEENIFPAAHELADRGIPFILTTGRSGMIGLLSEFAHASILAKPYDVWQLEDRMASVFRPSP
jgi:DNA-binding response OmpR family regulator